ncbi:branched-chain amino acid aminotransferase II [Gymnopus androsaceus JB14]|uniref:Branched-chain-amino-acid aminotransferase n=1 Tax=Gymnopus androsaceus JB14 TaxID=1447944 RepID=A0A6A4GS37_9AGAR|nr:branched-chain amino acid aminotransferase II [Gymnopus androsaceus JB14]
MRIPPNMAMWKAVGNGILEGISRVADLDASKLTITLSKTLKPIPKDETLLFGNIMSDHMVVAEFDPEIGWSSPEIKPLGPLSLDPTSSCLQYGTSVFEGMKAYIGPDGEPRLFRPDMNMARLARSAERMALPPFSTDQVLALIKQLIIVDRRWIPLSSGYSLYVRPVVMGTRTGLSVVASDRATLCIMLSPAGPYFRSGAKPTVSVLAVSETIRAWPGGTGEHKVGLNYSPGFLPLRVVQKQGYDLVLWLWGDDMKVTEAGAMNVFVVVARDDGGLDLLTPPLDGTILPGVTRDSILALAKAHTAGETTLPGLETQDSQRVRLHAQERAFTMAEMVQWSTEGKILEAFGAGTAVVIASIGKIGWKGKDLDLPVHEGLGPIANAFRTRILDIQEGREVWKNWSLLVTKL